MHNLVLSIFPKFKKLFIAHEDLVDLCQTIGCYCQFVILPARICALPPGLTIIPGVFITENAHKGE